MVLSTEVSHGIEAAGKSTNSTTPDVGSRVGLVPPIAPIIAVAPFTMLTRGAVNVFERTPLTLGGISVRFLDCDRVFLAGERIVMFRLNVCLNACLNACLNVRLK